MSRCLATSDLIDVDDLLPAAVAENTVDGELWALPAFVSTPVVYIDQSQFRAVGLDPTDVPEDLAQLRTMLEALRTQGGLADGFVTASSDWFISAWAADLGVRFAPDDGRTALGPEHLDLHDSALESRLGGLADLAEDGLVRYVDGKNYADLLLLTDPTAPAAMVLHTSGSMGTVYGLLEDGRFDDSELGVLPFPLTDSGTVLGGPSGWLLADSPTQQRASWAFLAYLSGPDAQAKIGTIGYAPVHRDALSDPGLQAAWTERPGLRVPTDVLWAIDPAGGHVGWEAGPSVRVAWRLDWAGHNVLDGRSIPDALDDAMTDLDSILASYRDARHQAAGAP